MNKNTSQLAGERTQTYKAPSKGHCIGDKSQRVRFEVQYYDAKKGEWYISWREKTLEAARQRITSSKKEAADLRWLVDFGPQPPMRIVHVVSECTIME